MKHSVRLACQAMATRFELILYGDDRAHLRAAGEEAVAEIERLHDRLSLFRGQSIVSRINKRAARMPVRVPPDVFYLLTRISDLYDITNGAFDVTVGPLLAAWGFRQEEQDIPNETEIIAALAKVGFPRLVLDKQHRTVSFSVEGMEIDLGGIGKGYALEEAAEILQSAGVTSALLHGGTSTVRAIGTGPDGNPWGVAVQRPFTVDEADSLGVVRITDEALSVSAPSGRSFKSGGQVYGHVVDPRSGYPVAGTTLAAIVLPNAIDADALSTALLVLGAEGIAALDDHVVGMRAAVLSDDTQRGSVLTGNVFHAQSRTSDITT